MPKEHWHHKLILNSKLEHQPLTTSRLLLVTASSINAHSITTPERGTFRLTRGISNLICCHYIQQSAFDLRFNPDSSSYLPHDLSSIIRGSIGLKSPLRMSLADFVVTVDKSDSKTSCQCFTPNSRTISWKAFTSSP
jgi:hypothetical protein